MVNLIPESNSQNLIRTTLPCQLYEWLTTLSSYHKLEQKYQSKYNVVSVKIKIDCSTTELQTEFNILIQKQYGWAHHHNIFNSSIQHRILTLRSIRARVISQAVQANASKALITGAVPGSIPSDSKRLKLREEEKKENFVRSVLVKTSKNSSYVQFCLIFSGRQIVSI